MSGVDNLFAGGARMVSEEAIELTLQSLRAYWDRHEHVAIAWSGGKDSTATLTLLIHLIEAGELPQPEFGGWPVRILADAYGGDDAEEINARTGCIACPLAAKDTALDYLVGTDAWAHLAPLKELKPLYRWMREPAQRLRKAGAETLKDGSLAKNPQRMGPLTLAAREEALGKILDIQVRARVDLINDEEEARIRELIAAGTFPDKWDGSEPNAAAWLDRVNQDGSIEPILFRDMVGA